MHRSPGRGTQAIDFRTVLDHSRSKYLAALPQEKQPRPTAVAFPVCCSAAVFLAHAYDAYQAG